MNSKKFLPENLRDTELFSYLTSLVDWLVSVNSEEYIQKLVGRFDVQHAKFDPEYMIRFLGSEDFLEISKTARSSFVYDSSGKGRSGVASRVVYKSDLGPDASGCFQFDGEGHVRTASFTETNPEGNQLTALIWVKAASQDGKLLWCHGDSGTETTAWQLRLSGSNNGKLEVLLSRNGSLSSIYYKQYRSSFIVGDNRWHQVGFRFNKGVLDLFVDGVRDSGVTKLVENELPTVYQSGSDLVIGAELSNNTVINRVSGYLDNPRLYSGALSDAEIKSLYSFEEVPSTNLALFYDFNMSQDQLKTLALLVSNLNNLKGTLKGIQYVFRLLNLDAQVYEWFHINEEWAGSNPVFPAEADPCSIIIDVNIGDYPLDEEIQDQLLTLLDTLIWTCVTVMEIRWRKVFVEVWDQPPDTIGIGHYLDIVDYVTGAEAFPFKYCPVLPGSYHIKLVGGQGNQACTAEADPVGATTVIAGPSVFYPDYQELLSHAGEAECDTLLDLTGFKFGFGLEDSFEFEDTISMVDTTGEEDSTLVHITSDEAPAAMYEASGLAPFRKSINLPNTGDYVNLGYHPGLMLNTFTVEGWFKTTNSANEIGFFHWNNGLANTTLFISYGAQNSGLIIMGTSNYRYFNHPEGINVRDGKWHHVAFTLPGTAQGDIANSTCYIDGRACSGGTPIQSGPQTAKTGPIRLGYYSQCSLDDVRVWSTVRTQGQIQASMNSELEGNETGLVAYWRFNEPSGTTVYDAKYPVLSAPKDYGLYFDGNDDAVDCGSDFLGTKARSVVGWVRPNTFAQGDRILVNGSTTAVGWNFYVGINGRINTYMNGISCMSADNVLVQNLWKHIAAVCSDVGMTSFYVDGALSGNVDQNSGPVVSGNSNVFLGNYSGRTLAFDGLLSEFYIFGRTLAPHEAKALKSGNLVDLDTDASLLLDLPLQKGREAYGPELVVNGNFSSWSGAADPNNTPTGWTKSSIGTTYYITNSSGACRLVTDGNQLYITQSITVIGKTYRFSGNVTSITGSFGFFGAGGASIKTLASGINSGVYKATTVAFAIQRAGGAGDMTVDDVSVREYWLQDLSISSRRAYPQNAPTWVALPSGLTVLDFNGTTDLLDCGVDFLGTGNISIEAWIRPESSGENSYGRILDNGGFHFAISPDGDGYSLTLIDGNQVYAGKDILLNTWNHVVLTRTAAGVTNFYVNKVLSGTANQNSGTPAAAVNNTIVGNNLEGTRSFDGQISAVRVYNEVKPLSFFADRYDSTKGYYLTTGYTEPPAYSDGLLAHYPMNEGAGTTVHDLSGNNRNGTTLGSPDWFKYPINRTISGTITRVAGAPIPQREVPSGQAEDSSKLWYATNSGAQLKEDIVID